MSRAAERFRRTFARKNQDPFTTPNEVPNALERFASEEELSGDAVINTPATDPLSEFDSEEATSPQHDLMTAPAGGLPEFFQPSRLADHDVALTIRIKRRASRRRPIEVKRYAAPAGIAAAVAIGLTLIVLGRPPAVIATKTPSTEPIATRATAFAGNHFPLVPALSPAPLYDLSSQSPRSAHPNATESDSAAVVTRRDTRDTIVAAEIVPRSGVLLQPAVLAADVPAAPRAILAATPVVLSPSAPVAAVRTTAALAPVDHVVQTDMIQAVLGRYQGAFRALDSAAASAVWPTVDRKALGRAFERLEEQQIEFDKCQITIEDRQAVASCDGQTRYVPRVGNRSPRTERRQWTFTLLRHDLEWLIDRVESR